MAVIGHLRDVKDPFRAAEAARRLPARSRIRIVHLGAAETPQWTARAQAEMKANPRYVWRGDRPRAEVRRLLGRARAMVLSSLSEGGANVISEAVAAGVPVLASRIDGSVGLLGRDYPGYFPVGDTAALARLLHRHRDAAGIPPAAAARDRAPGASVPAGARKSGMEKAHRRDRAEIAIGATAPPAAQRARWRRQHRLTNM